MFAVGVAALVLAACGRPLGAAPLGWPQVLPSFSGLRRVALTAAWTRPLSWPSSLSVSPDGSVVAGDGVAGPWAFEANGQSVPLGGAPGSAVFAADQGMVAVGPGPSGPAGAVGLYDASGVVWSQAAVGPVSVVSSTDRILVLDAGTGSGALLALQPGGVSRVPLPALRVLGPSAGALLDNSGDLLLYDQQGVEWFSPQGGQPLWTVRARTGVPVRQLALSPDGLHVTAATGQGDDTLYQFALQGASPSLVWTEPLAPGGSNLLSVAPNGNIAVWDVGGGATVAVYRASNGAMLWQDTLPSPPGAPVALLDVAFGPQNGVVAAVDNCQGGAPCLLFLSPSGAPLGYAPLPAGTRVALATGGAVAVGGVPATGPVRGPQRAGLSFWNLGPLWQSLMDAGPSSVVPPGPVGAGAVHAPSSSVAAAERSGRRSLSGGPGHWDVATDRIALSGPGHR